MINRLDDFRAFVAAPFRMGLLLAILGFAVWTSLSLWSGLTTPEVDRHLREAWDTSAYFTIGMPVMALAVGVAAFVHPERPWRWPLALVGGHQAGMLLFGLGMQSAASLVILAVILGAMLGAGFAVPALIGSTAARRLMHRAY